jgi:hypothetical protein
MISANTAVPAVRAVRAAAAVPAVRAVPAVPLNATLSGVVVLSSGLTFAFSGTGSLFNTSFTWTAYYDALENGQYNWEFKAKGSTPSSGTIATCRFSK